jgi:hypothetical protein
MSTTVNQIMIWIPKNAADLDNNDDELDNNDAGLEVAQIMINNLKVKKIKTERYRNFRELFQKAGATSPGFCFKMNTEYLLDYAEEYLTLVSVKQQKNDFAIQEIYAILVFKVNKMKTPSNLEVIAFCGNDKSSMAKGHGTKLLNLIKQTMSLAQIDDIILNPLDTAIPYYVKQFFHLAVPGDDIYVAENHKMMKSHLPTEKRLRKPQSLKRRSASHTSKPRSASHTSKRRSASHTFYRPSSHERLSNLSFRSSEKPRKKEEDAYILKILSAICKDYDSDDPIDKSDVIHQIKSDFYYRFRNDTYPDPQLSIRQEKLIISKIPYCR